MSDGRSLYHRSAMAAFLVPQLLLEILYRLLLLRKGFLEFAGLNHGGVS